MESTMSEHDRHGGSAARQRILDCACDLFAHRGVHSVSVDELVERADVGKATFYRHFPSKEDLVVAFLAQREQVWVHGWLEKEAKTRGGTPEEQLLAIFDLLSEWFASDDFKGDAFINTLLETGDRQPAISHACVAGLRSVRSVVFALAVEAGLRDPEQFALSCQTLINGSIVQAAQGDLNAARRAQTMAQSLIDHHRNLSAALAPRAL